MEENRATTYYYAYINDQSIVEQIVAMPTPISIPNYISIPANDQSLIGKRYNKETGEFETVTWFSYVMLNGKDIVTEVLRRETQVPEPVPDYMIQIPNYDETLVGKWYNRKDGTFSEPPIHVLADLSTDKINVGTQDLWLTDKLGSVDSAVNQVNAAVDGAVNQVGSMNSTVTALDGKVTELAGTVVAADSKVSELVGTVAAVDGKLSAVDTKVTGVTGKVTAAEGKITTLEGKATAAESKMATVEGKVGTLESQMSSTSSTVGSLNTQVGSLNSTLTTVGGKVNTAEGKIVSLEGRVGTVENKVSTAEGKVGTLVGQMSTANSNIGTINTKVGSMGAQLDFMAGLMNRTLLAELSEQRDNYIFESSSMTKHYSYNFDKPATTLPRYVIVQVSQRGEPLNQVDDITIVLMRNGQNTDMFANFAQGKYTYTKSTSGGHSKSFEGSNHISYTVNANKEQYCFDMFNLNSEATSRGGCNFVKMMVEGAKGNTANIGYFKYTERGIEFDIQAKYKDPQCLVTGFYISAYAY